MKTIIILLLSLSVFSNIHARGIPIPVCIPCEKIATVKVLPESEDLLGEYGEKLNLGYYYSEYGAVFVPAWNTSGVYVLTDEKEETYYEIDEEFKLVLETSYGVSFEAENPLSFWKKIGGKIIFGILLVIIIFGMLGKDDDEDE